MISETKARRSFDANNETTLTTANIKKNNNNKKRPRKSLSKKAKKIDISQFNETSSNTFTLLQYGYRKQESMCDTLQGEVFLATVLHPNQSKFSDSTNPNVTTAVIKRTSKALHKAKITIQNGLAIPINEDVVREAAIMKLLCKQRPPKSMIQFYDFFEDEHSYYLAMEHGGTSFFDFVIQCHSLIAKGKLTINEWRRQCKFMFAQMMQFTKWFHSKGFCNLDISMENMLISHDCYLDENTGKLVNCNIKFIDFGLSEYFPNFNFECTKYCGKINYKAPKVYGRKKVFDATKADIWSSGVVLFMMLVGCPPFHKPSNADPLFVRVKDGSLMKSLQNWDRIKYLTAHSLDLLKKMLNVNESDRFNTDQICQHKWLYHYFVNEYEYRADDINDNSNNNITSPSVASSVVIITSPSVVSTSSSTTAHSHASRNSYTGSYFAALQMNKININIPESHSTISDCTTNSAITLTPFSEPKHSPCAEVVSSPSPDVANTLLNVASHGTSSAYV